MSIANVTQTGQAATVAVTVSRGLQGATGATGSPGTTDYNELDNVPSEFPPESHTHPVSDIVSITSQRLLGRHANGSGAGQEVTVGNGIEFSGSGIGIGDDSVTNARLTNVPTATIKGRITAGTGDPEDLTPAQAIEVIGAATPSDVAARYLRYCFTIHTVAGGEDYTVTDYSGTIVFQSASFSAAFNFANNHDNSGYRKRIHLSGGHPDSIDTPTRPLFLVDEKIEINSSVIITGDGDNATVVEAHPDFDDDFMFGCGETTFLGSIVIFDGIRFHSLADGSHSIINFKGVTQPKLKNCGIFTYKDGVVFDNASIYSALVENCEIRTHIAGAVGLRVLACGNLTISDSTIRTHHSGSASTGILIEGGNAINVHNNVFMRSGGSHIALRATGGIGLSFLGNTLRDWLGSHSPVQFDASAAHDFHALLADNNAPATVNTSTGALISVGANSNRVCIAQNLATGFSGGLYTAAAPLEPWSAAPDPAVVSVATDQTVSGQKTFTAPMVSTGTPSADTHVLNRVQADARLGAVGLAATSLLNITSQITPQTIRSAVLQPGLYHVRMYFILSGTANTGTRHGYSFDGTAVVRFLRTRATALSASQIISNSFDIGLSEASTTAWIEGIINVTATGTFAMQAAQNTSHADILTIAAANHMIITPCPYSTLI